MKWYRNYFGFSNVSSSCDLQKGMVRSAGLLLWWHMSFMDRVPLWSYYVRLYIGIYLWIHSIHYGGYDDDVA